MLAVDDAPLANFSPKTTDQCSYLQDINTNAMALAFRMVPGYCQLMVGGETCPPGNLKRATFGYENWSDCVVDKATPCFEYLGTREGSYYYGLVNKSYWMVLDLNSRLAGGNLVTINSADENTFVHNLRQAWRPGEYIALGLYDWGQSNNDFAWRSGEPVTFTYWLGDEPNNNEGREYFAAMKTVHSSWNDYPGTDECYGIMEIDRELPDPGADPVPALILGESPIFLGELGEVDERPYVVRNVYWTKVFQKTLGAGATYSELHSYTTGTSETNGMSFGWSIGIETTVEWAFASARISAEFHQDFDREVTVYDESTVEKTYECTAPPNKTVIFAVWQLRERYTICNADGEIWSDPKYELDGELPYLDQGLDQEYLQTLYFDQ